MFVSKGSYGCGEPKNVIALSVQQTHWPLRTCKLHGFMHRRIYPTMEIWENLGYPSPWYRVCTKAMFVSKGSYGCGEPKNVIALSVQQTHWPLRTCKLHGFMHRRIYPTMEISKIRATYRHGTVFAPRQCLYQKEATGVGSLKM